jgi:hypothetical protein
VKQGYRDILGAGRNDRRQVYSEATEAWPTSASFIEKDFIVCATLDILFGDLSGAEKKLVFKGGTSLSKAHNLIRRFSEDIDLVIVREELGFKDDSDPMRPGNTLSDGTRLSNKARERLVDALKLEAAKFVASELKPVLEEQLSHFGMKVEIDPDPKEEGQTLLIAYPSVFDTRDDYVPPIVKIEAGARSATLPAHAARIEPYAGTVLEELDLAAETVQTIDAERTFLDKLVILHGRHCHFRDRGAVYKNAKRESRHYYDLAMMADEVGPRALPDTALLEDVVRHSSLAFRSGWMRFDEAERGDLLILPPDGVLPDLKRDYEAMTGMILGDAPAFDWVIAKVGDIAGRYERLRAGR